MSVEPPSISVPRIADGRRMRSTRSRARIVAALLKLVRGGNLAPSAAQVADAAKVSLRTVFRHFDDMDSLYMEVGQLVEKEVRPLLSARLESADWRDRLRSQVSVRSRIYESILPFKIAADARRSQSSYLDQAYTWFLDMERAGLESVVPEPVRDDIKLFAALQMASSFETWRRLRHDQSLSVDAATAALDLVITSLICVTEREA